MSLLARCYFFFSPPVVFLASAIERGQRSATLETSRGLTSGLLSAHDICYAVFVSLLFASGRGGLVLLVDIRACTPQDNEDPSVLLLLPEP